MRERRLGASRPEAHDLKIVTGLRQAIAVPVNADDAYRITTVVHSIDMVVTEANGTARQIPFAWPGANRSRRP